MKVGDRVRVVGTHSVNSYLLGYEGEITGTFFDKLIVQFIPSIDGVGSLSHTALPEDLELLGHEARGETADD